MTESYRWEIRFHSDQVHQLAAATFQIEDRCLVFYDGSDTAVCIAPLESVRYAKRTN